MTFYNKPQVGKEFYALTLTIPGSSSTSICLIVHCLGSHARISETGSQIKQTFNSTKRGYDEDSILVICPQEELDQQLALYMKAYSIKIANVKQADENGKLSPYPFTV